MNASPPLSSLNEIEWSDTNLEYSEETESEPKADGIVHEPHYSRRDRVAREIDGAIPWDAVPLG